MYIYSWHRRLITTYIVLAKKSEISEDTTPDQQVGSSKQHSTRLILCASLQIYSTIYTLNILTHS